MIKTYITVPFQTHGLHMWPNAPSMVQFLRNKHYHVFNIEVCLEVQDDDRELEFYTVRDLLSKYCDFLDPVGIIDYGSRSCEQIAKEIANQIDDACHNWFEVLRSICVQEDDDSSALVVWS